MNITVTYKTKSGECNIQIDRKQEIGEGLRILQKNGRTATIGFSDFLRSDSLGRIVSTYCTFEELGIYSGDILSATD